MSKVSILPLTETTTDPRNILMNIEIKLAKKTLKPTSLILLLLLSSATFAGCGEEKGTCYYYKAGELKSKGACQIATCSNMSQTLNTTWTWDENMVEISTSVDSDGYTINGKPSYELPFEFKNKNLRCFGIVGTDEIMCDDSENY